MTSERACVAAAAAGIFVMLTVCLVTLAVVSSTSMVNAAPTDNDIIDDPPPSDLLKHLSLLYQGTYVLYGKGRRSERDLPVCATAAEACNLSHRRYWLTPVTERLCRCADRSDCPIHFTSLNDTKSQHVSNRAQLKFCSGIVEELPVCANGEPALKIKKVERKELSYPPHVEKPEGTDTHSTLLCQCPWPNQWTLVKTTIASDTETLLLYTCDEWITWSTHGPSASETFSCQLNTAQTAQLILSKFYTHGHWPKISTWADFQPLPKCKMGDECGRIRADTLESYYSCSCPEQHVCIYKSPQRTEITSRLHFEGHTYTATCMPN